MKTLVFILVVFTLLPSHNTAQNPTIDDLLAISRSNVHDTIRAQTFLDIGDFYEHSLPDSAIYYYSMAQKLAKKNSSKHKKFQLLNATALRYIGIIYQSKSDYDSARAYFAKSVAEAEITDSKKAIAFGYMNIGVTHVKQGNYDSALAYYNKAMITAEAMNDSFTIARCHGNIGEVNWYMGNFDKSVEYFLRQLNFSEQKNDLNGMMMCYNNLGAIFSAQLDYNKSIYYFEKALKIVEAFGDKRSISACTNNIGIIYYEMGEPEIALKYYKKALALSEEIGDKLGTSYSLNSIGIAYYGKRDFNKAIEYYLKLLTISKDIGDKNAISLALGNLAGAHIALADSFKNNKNLKNHHINKAIEYGTQAFSLSKEINALLSVYNNAKELFKAHKAAGNNIKAIEYAEIMITTKDSLFREEKTKAIADMQTKYETEKKQQEIEKQQLIITKQDVEMRRQRLQRNFFIVGSLLLGLLVLVVLRSYRQKQLSNRIITEKNVLLEQANEEIAAQRDLVVEQKEHIEMIHEELTSSIRYARRIQGAVLPSAEQMNKLLGDHFVLFRPKDIVSGDFYWVTKVSSHTIFCVADCTGHGVPGAFMSMLGVSYLNDIVHKEHIISAAEILNHLRESIIAALKQHSDGSEQKDGMDMGLCVLDTQTLQMQFAGGYNPCWIIPNLEHMGSRIFEPQSDNDSSPESPIVQIKPDKMPIAIHKHMESYTNHLLQLYPGDKVYLMSDGFQDQFGGSQGKKFMVKNLRDLLAANANLPMVEQLNHLEAALEEWMGGTEQVDDITILGIKV
jgi:serine phosphatase RsbU (regulator of sigma subunit)/Tfp pilus assembly protein PilF